MGEQASLGEISDKSKSSSERKRRPEIKGKAEDWQVVDLQDIVEIKGGGTPSKSKEEYWNGKIPWASVKDLTELTDLWKKETEDNITEKGLEESNSNLIPEDSVIISTRMTVGEPFINLEEMSINQDLKGLIPDTEKVNPGFLLYALWGKDNFLKSLGRGTTVSGITTRDLERLGIALPEKDEQRRIASVLYNMDQAIQKTEEIIEQTQRVKKGLMQDLFTEGYYSHEEFVDTPWSSQPKDWDRVTLEQIGDFKNGLDFSGDQKGRGTKIANVPNVYGSQEIPTENLDRVSISDSERERFGLEKDDIILVRSSKKKEGVGQAAIFKGCDEDVVFAGFTIRLRPESDEIIPEYLVQYLRYPKMRGRVVSIAGDNALTNVSQSDYKRLEIPLPSKNEQKKIVESLEKFDEKKDNLMDQKKQLQRLKKGLMQDLLTGSVRTDESVAVLDEVVEVER